MSTWLLLLLCALGAMMVAGAKGSDFYAGYAFGLLVSGLLVGVRGAR